MDFFKFSLSKEDFLRFQLVTASKSKRIRNKRIRSWILLTLSFLLIGFLFNDSEEKFLSYYFYFISIITLIFYPFYNSWYYKRHYKKHIEEHYKSKIGIESEINFDEEHIYSRDALGEGKIKISEIIEISELPENILIKFTTGDTLIIPKTMNEYYNFEKVVKHIATSRGLTWNTELNWKWR